MYAIVRKDLQMPPGKLSAQAGHAYVDSYRKCQQENEQIANDYCSDNHGTKVTLGANTLDDIRKIEYLANKFKIPYALIVDSEHIMPPFFDGNPIVTAIGLGPARRSEMKKITYRYQLVK